MSHSANLMPPLASQLYGALLYQVGGVAIIVVLFVGLALPQKVRLVPQRCDEPNMRRLLRIGLGLLWVFDGLLQAQPLMPSQFVSRVVAPVAKGEPAWLAGLMSNGSNLWQAHPVILDCATVWFQIAIGLLLLAGGASRWSRIGALLSVGWALAIWVGGEALGAMLLGGATALAGAPGSALIYAAIGTVVVIDPSRWNDRVAQVWFSRIFGLFWVAMAVIQALPFERFWSSAQLSALFASSSRSLQPSGLNLFGTWLARSTGSHPALWNSIFVTMMAGIGAMWLVMVPRSRNRSANFAAAVTLIWLLLVWWLAMGFGFLGGTGTDPNTAVPLALVVLATAWPKMKLPLSLRPLASRRNEDAGVGIRGGFRGTGISGSFRGAWLRVPGAEIATLAGSAGVASGFAGLLMASILMLPVIH